MITLCSHSFVVDYMRFALLSLSYFVINFEEMAPSAGLYCFDFSAKVEGYNFEISVKYTLPDFRGEICGFNMTIACADLGVKPIFRGSHLLACHYVVSVIDDFISATKVRLVRGED